VYVSTEYGWGGFDLTRRRLDLELFFEKGRTQKSLIIDSWATFPSSMRAARLSDPERMVEGNLARVFAPSTAARLEEAAESSPPATC
jgi:hypothetical protein